MTDTPRQKDISDMVRAYRAMHRMTQDDLAARMQERGHNWTQATVSRVESGRMILRVPEAVALAEVFRVTINDLLGAHGG